MREGREYVGVSGHAYKIDLEFDGRAVLAIGTHAASVNSAAMKLLDIGAATSNQKFDVSVVIDDRFDPEAAKANPSYSIRSQAL